MVDLECFILKSPWCSLNCPVKYSIHGLGSITHAPSQRMWLVVANLLVIPRGSEFPCYDLCWWFLIPVLKSGPQVAKAKQYSPICPVTGLPRWLRGRESSRQCRRHRFESGRSPWRRKWQPTPVFLPGKSHGQRSLRATVHGVTQSQTQLKQLSTHSRMVPAPFL